MKTLRKKPVISALEQRMLFDGAAIGTAVDVLDKSSFSTQTNDTTVKNSDVTNDNAENSVHKIQATPSNETTTRKEVAFVDTSVKDYETLVQGIGDNVEIYLVNSLDEIQTILKHETEIDALHVLSHGSTGEITVGNDVLNQNTLAHYDALIQTIKNAMSENGDVLLYGCDVAANGEGQAFVNAVAASTDADIAASNDTTGVGGDWDLEINIGNIEAHSFAINNFKDNLATINVLVFSKPNMNGSDSNPVESDESANLASIVKYFINGTHGYSNTYTAYDFSSFNVDSSLTTYSDANLETKLNNASFLFMPDMESGFNLSTDLPNAAKTVLSNWVHDGGIMMMTGTAGNLDTNFLNAIFGWDLTTQSGSSWNLNTTNAVSTPFEGGPASLSAPSATDSIGKGTVSTFKAIYGTDSDATVAVIDYGSGKVIFLGYDFYAAGISGTGFTSTSTQFGADVSTGGTAGNDWVQQIVPRALQYSAMLSGAGDVGEDGSFTFSSDGFKEGGTILPKVKITSLPTHGTLTLSGTAVSLNQEISSSEYANLVFTPESNYNGADGFTWQGWSTTNGTYSANVNYNITISSVDDAPVFNALTPITYNDSSLNDEFSILPGTASATDIDSASLAYSIIGTGVSDGGATVSLVGSYGTLVLNKTTGAYTYAPNATSINALSATATESFTLQVSDGTNTVTQNLTVTLNGINDLPIITGSETVTVNEDTSITISGISVSDNDAGSNVKVTISSNHGNLSLGSSGGVTVSGTGTHTLEITGSTANLNSTLATLRYQADSNWFGDDPLTITVNDNQGSGDQPYRINQTGKFFNTLNGHYYEFVSASGISWTDAKTAAEARTLYGLNGYLVTITSANENALITSMAGGNGWIGASDSVSEGIWKWVTGPEAGTQFWTGDTSAGTNSTSHYGSAYNSQYANWDSGEPNNSDASRGGEDVAHFYYSGANAGKWNDFAANNTSAIAGYIVEYGGAGGTLSAAQLTVKVLSVNDAPTLETSQTANYTENGSPIALSPSLTLSDIDNTTLASAQVSISSGFLSGDILSFTNDGSTMGNITAIYNSSTGVLTLTSSGATATLAQWQSALRSVTYHSTSETLSLTQTTRTVSWKINDGNLESTVDTSTLHVTGVNDAPTISVSTPSGFTEATGIDNQNMTQSGTVTFGDVDSNVNVTYSYNNDIAWSGGTLNSTLSSALSAGFYASATNASSGTTTWSYSVNNVDLNFLAEGETITFSYDVIATDTASATQSTRITFTITGTNDAPVFGTITSGGTGVVTAPSAGTTAPSAGVEIFNNGLLRFGSGTIDSVNPSTGMLEQPWYYKDGVWNKLTFSSYQLNMAIAADYNSGSAKTDTDWNLEGTVNLTPTFTNTTVDNSGFNTATGTGTIVWSGEITVGTAHLKVTNVYALESGAKYIKANTYITNLGTTSTENLRFWVGTRDDFVAGSDSPAKQKGNIVDGEFTMISNASEQAKAIKIYTGTGANATAVLFYSTNENVNTVIAPGYGWTTSNQYAPGIDPLNSVYNQSYDDGGYAMFTNLNNINASQTVMFDWYYAAGAVSELSNITSSLEHAASTNLQEHSSSLVLSDDYTITDLDVTDEVNVAVSSVQVTLPSGLTLPSSYTEEIIKNMLHINSNPVIGNDSTTGTVSWSFNSGAEHTFNFLGRGQTLTLLYTLTATDSQGATATTTVSIAIDGVNDTPTVVVDAGDSDVATVNETNTTLSSSGTLSIEDIDTMDTSFTVSKVGVVASGATEGLTLNTNALLNMLTVSTHDSDVDWSFNSGSNYFNALPAGETLTLTYTISVKDSGNASVNKTITVHIVGTNDNVALNTPATIYYTDTDANDVFNATSSSLSATDIDHNTVFEYGIDGGVLLNSTVTKVGLYGTLTLNTVTGAYTYTPDSDVINALRANASEAFTVTVSDNDGSTDTKQLVIAIDAVNDAPLLGGALHPKTFVENGSPVQVDSDITVTDLEGTSYDGGYISFAVTTHKESLDTLAIASLGGISFEGLHVKYGNTIIGTIDSVLNGENGKELRVHLNENAYSSHVQALARAITFSNASDNFSDAARTVEIKVNDGGNGGETAARYSVKTASVNLQSINDLPSIDLNTTTLIVEKIIGQNDDGTLAIGSVLRVSDLDDTTLSITIETTRYGHITINDSITNGLNASQIIGNGSRVVTLSGTIDQINATLAASNGVTYVAGYGNDYITPGADYVKITARDALNGTNVSEKLVMVLPAIPNIYSDNIVGAEDNTSSTIANINDLVTDINDNGGTFVFGTGTPDITNASGTITTAGTFHAFDASTYIYDSNSKVIGYQLTNGKIILNEGKNRIDHPDYAKFTFIPNENWYGYETFLYQFTSNDGEVSNIAQVAFFVTPVNDAPVITIASTTVTINEDTPFVFDNTHAIVLSDVDVIDATQRLDVTLHVTNGTLELSQMTGLSVLEGSNHSSILKIRGSLEDLQNAINGLTYTPNRDYNGSDSLTISINDLGNIGEGNRLEATQTIAITINALNDSPVFEAQSGSVIEGEHLQGVLPASDVDSGSITFSVNGTAPEGFVLHDDGSFTFDSSSYNYIGQGETDTIVIPIAVTDAEGLTTIANFSITITGTNDAPTVASDNINVEIPFGDVYNKDISVLFSDSDASNVFTFEATNLPIGLSIDPVTGVISGRASQSGVFEITLKATDPFGATISRTYSMLVIAPAPLETAKPAPSSGGTTDTTTTTGTSSGGTNPLGNTGTTGGSLGGLGVINYAPSTQSSGLPTEVGRGFLSTTPSFGNEASSGGSGGFGTSNAQETPRAGTDAPSSGSAGERGTQNERSASSGDTTTQRGVQGGSGALQANVDVNVLTNGQIVFNQSSRDSFSIVGIAIEEIKLVNNYIEVKVVDTNLAQSFVVTLADGTELPKGLSFDPRTGNITGTLLEELETLHVSIKAINSDGTTRVLNLTIDLKQLKNKNQTDAKSFVGFKEQIALETQRLEHYGSYLTKLLA